MSRRAGAGAAGGAGGAGAGAGDVRARREKAGAAAALREKAGAAAALDEMERSVHRFLSEAGGAGLGAGAGAAGGGGPAPPFLDPLPPPPPPLREARIADLRDQDKAKVAKLIQQVVKLSQDNDRLVEEAGALRAARDRAEAERRDEASAHSDELTAWRQKYDEARAKFAQSLSMLKTYQDKIQELEERAGRQQEALALAAPAQPLPPPQPHQQLQQPALEQPAQAPAHSADEHDEQVAQLREQVERLTALVLERARSDGQSPAEPQPRSPPRPNQHQHQHQQQWPPEEEGLLGARGRLERLLQEDEQRSAAVPRATDSFLLGVGPRSAGGPQRHKALAVPAPAELDHGGGEDEEDTTLLEQFLREQRQRKLERLAKSAVAAAAGAPATSQSQSPRQSARGVAPQPPTSYAPAPLQARGKQVQLQRPQAPAQQAQAGRPQAQAQPRHKPVAQRSGAPWEEEENESALLGSTVGGVLDPNTFESSQFETSLFDVIDELERE
jgi:hypothetical protein